MCKPRVDWTPYLCMQLPSQFAGLCYPSTDIPGSTPLGRECECDRAFEFQIDGCYLCSNCGQVQGSYYEDMPSWHGLSTRGPSTCYDCRTHLANHLAPVTKYIDAWAIEKIKATFPLIYRTFFKIAPTRKNFCSYGFVIKKMLEMMGVPCEHIPLKIVKTKQKLRENENYWTAINESIKINLY